MALALAPGHTAGNLGLRLLIGGVPEGGHLVGDRGYDAAWARNAVRDRGATPHIPSLKNRATQESVSAGVHRARNAVERLVNRLKHFRRVAARYDKAAGNYLAAVTLAAIRLWARFESTT